MWSASSRHWRTGPVRFNGSFARRPHRVPRRRSSGRTCCAALVLAEPGGDLDASLRRPANPRRRRCVAPAIDRGRSASPPATSTAALGAVAERADGPGAWRAGARATVRQTWRDNARTLLGQADEQRQPFTPRRRPRRSACRRCSWAASRRPARCRAAVAALAAPCSRRTRRR